MGAPGVVGDVLAGLGGRAWGGCFVLFWCEVSVGVIIFYLMMVLGWSRSFHFVLFFIPLHFWNCFVKQRLIPVFSPQERTEVGQLVLGDG